VRTVLTFPVLLVALVVAQAAPVRAETCIADKHGGLVCGEGERALRVIADTISPSKQYAFAWRSPNGLPSGQDIPMGVENVLVRLSDGEVLSKLGGAYWMTGEMRPNRYDLLVVWSPDSKAVVEVANSRWDSDSFAYYFLDGKTVTKVDLRALVEPAMKAKLPKRQREFQSFRVREELPVTFDARGRLSFTAMIYRPKTDPSLDCRIQVDITTKRGKPSARLVSMRRVKSD
jgi:hypothetical protein